MLSYFFGECRIPRRASTRREHRWGTSFGSVSSAILGGLRRWFWIRTTLTPAPRSCDLEFPVALIAFVHQVVDESCVSESVRPRRGSKPDGEVLLRLYGSHELWVFLFLSGWLDFSFFFFGRECLCLDLCLCSVCSLYADPVKCRSEFESVSCVFFFHEGLLSVILRISIGWCVGH